MTVIGMIAAALVGAYAEFTLEALWEPARWIMFTGAALVLVAVWKHYLNGGH